MKRGNWTDNECFAGPFHTHQEALNQVEPAREIGNKMDNRAWFCGWGTVKMKDGHREGKLNEQLRI